MENSKLNLYFEDIEGIFESIKSKYRYQDFCESNKKAFDKVIQECINETKKVFSEIYLDTEKAVLGLCDLSVMVDKLIFGFKFADEIYKSSIYQINPWNSLDSIKVNNFSNKHWKTLINVDL